MILTSSLSLCTTRLTGPLPFLICTPFPNLLAFGTESQGVVVEIYSYEMGHRFKNKLRH